MDISNTPIEDTIKFLLQRDLLFVINNRTIKRGKLILFKQNNFCIDLHIIQPTKTTHSIYTIPIPYDTKIFNSHVLFDYTLNTLVKNNHRLYNLIKDIKPPRKTKFYDTQLIMRF